jgi:hypothetical protein
MILAAAGPYLYVATSGGVWRRPLAEMVTEVQLAREQVPVEFRLEQNYPNPFNPKTRIQYTVGGTRDLVLGASKTRLVVFDLLGRQVATLVNEVKPPGSYEITFDGSGLSSGVYFYRLTAGNFVETRRMLLMR